MKILIADDHSLFRDGLILNLQELNSQAEIWQVGSYQEAELVLQQHPNIDLIIADLDMPDKHWQEGLESLMSKAPQAIFVVISATEDAKIIQQVMGKGVRGYIPKRSEPKIIIAALKLVMDGGSYLPPILLEKIVQNKNVAENKAGNLTSRQAEVLQYISQGLSNKQIAHEMGVSEATVKLHINAMFKTLKATNRTQALVNAQKLGLI